jgi:hypothetical protein
MLFFSSESHRSLHVRGVATFRNGGRAAIDVAVPDLARLVVLRIFRRDHLACGAFVCLEAPRVNTLD